MIAGGFWISCSAISHRPLLQRIQEPQTIDHGVCWLSTLQWGTVLEGSLVLIPQRLILSLRGGTRPGDRWDLVLYAEVIASRS